MTVRARCARCRCAIPLSFSDCCRQQGLPDGRSATVWKVDCPVCGRELKLPFLVDFTAVMVAVVVTGMVGYGLIRVAGLDWFAAALALPLLWLVAGLWRYCFVEKMFTR